MAGSLSVLGPDGPFIEFPLVDLDGDGPYHSDPVEVSLTNTGDTALAYVEIGDNNETGHLEISEDQLTWTASFGLPNVLMPGESKTLYVRAAFSEEDEEGMADIVLSYHARSIPVEAIHMVQPRPS